MIQKHDPRFHQPELKESIICRGQSFVVDMFFCVFFVDSSCFCSRDLFFIGSLYGESACHSEG